VGFAAPYRQSGLVHWPLAAVIFDRLGTTAIEGTTDEMWFQTMDDRRAEAAALNAMASGSQQRTLRLSVPAAFPHLAICATRDAARAQHWFRLGAQSIFERAAASRSDPDAASPDRVAIGLADRALCCCKPGAHEVG
jgi:hypothetical protein